MMAPANRGGTFIVGVQPGTQNGRQGTVWGAVFGYAQTTNDPSRVSGGTFNVGIRSEGGTWGAQFSEPRTSRTGSSGGTMYVGSRNTWGVSFR
jgi:hypothetical protein